jgi:hypothetical protein
MVGWTIVFWLDDLVWNVSNPNSEGTKFRSLSETICRHATLKIRKCGVETRTASQQPSTQKPDIHL